MPRSTDKRYAVAAAGPLVLSLALLTGCSGDPAEPGPLAGEGSETTSAAADPSPEPSASPSADPSSSGSASPAAPPTLPPEARGTTRASAGPFVRYWVDTFNYATNSLDTSAMRRGSYTGCQACSEIAASVDRVRRAGGHFEGDGWAVKRTTLLPPGRPGRPQVRAFIEYLPQVVIEAEDAEPKRFKGGRTLVYTFELGERRGRWAVSGLVGVPQ